MTITMDELNIYDPYDVYINQNWGDNFKYNQIHDKLKNIPNELFDFLFDLKTGDFIKDRVSVPLQLNEHQSKGLAVLVLEFILADTYLGNIVNEIKNRLGVDEIKATIIAGLVVAELFSPILEELKKRHVEKFAQGKTSRPQQQGDDRTVDLRNNL